MKVDGGCLCGHVAYEAEVDSKRVAICHCTDCQIHSASAYGVVVPIVGDRFTLLSGSLKVYVKTAESGTRRALSFCPECGTRIHAKTVGKGSPLFGLRVGTVRQRDQLKPAVQIWCRSMQSWIGDLGSIPRLNEQPTVLN